MVFCHLIVMEMQLFSVVKFLRIREMLQIPEYALAPQEQWDGHAEEQEAGGDDGEQEAGEQEPEEQELGEQEVGEQELMLEALWRLSL